MAPLNYFFFYPLRSRTAHALASYINSLKLYYNNKSHGCCFKPPPPMLLQIMQRQNEIFPKTAGSAVQIAIYLQASAGPRDVRSPSPPPSHPPRATWPMYAVFFFLPIPVTNCKPPSRFISLRADWICDARRRCSCLKEANSKTQRYDNVRQSYC